MSNDEPSADTQAAFERTLTADGRAARPGDVGASDQDFGDLPEIDPDNYVAGAEFARGGMGRIVAMRDRRLGRRVAVKELLRDDPVLARRFEREALITSQLQHPAIVSVYEAGRWPTGEPFFAMKLVDGRSLKEVIADTTDLPQRMALLPNIITVVEALAYAHERKVIHRDLKPANVLIGDYGETVVIDWGLAKSLAGAGDDDEADAAMVGVASGETVAGTVLGTPAYMAPEQARGDEATERTDVYALGALLYATFAGHAPYAGPSAQSVLEKVTSEPPAPLVESAPDLPADLHAIVAKAMARDPAARYPSAIELARDLNRFQTGQLVRAHDYSAGALVMRWLRRHRAAVTVAIAALLVVGVGGVVSVRRVVSERDRAQQAQSDAEAAERASRKRADELVLSHARSIVDSDPLAALAWLRKLSAGSDAWSAARTIAARAVEGGLPRIIDAHVHDVQRFDVSPDGKTIAVVSAADGESRDWLLVDVATGKARHGGGHAARIRSVKFSHDGKRVVTASDDNTAIVWNPTGGGHTTLRAHAGFVTGASFSDDDQRVLTVALDGSARVWDLARATTLATIRGPYGIGMSGDGRFVSTVPRDRPTVLLLRDLKTNQTYSLAGHKTRIWAYDYAPDSRHAASADLSGEVRVWDLTSHESKRLGAHDGRVRSLVWTPDGKQVITAGDDRTVHVWTVATGDQWVFRDHTEAVVSVQVSPDGRWLAARSRNKAVRIIDLHSHQGRLLARRAEQMMFMPDSQRLLTLNVDNDFELWSVGPRDGHRFDAGKRVRSLALSPAGNRMLVAGGGQSLRLIDRRTGMLRELRGHNAEPLAVAVSPDGRLAASLSMARRVRLWQLSTGASVELPGLAVLHLSFSPDGEYLAAPGDLESIRLWRVRSGKLTTLRGHTGWVKQVAFSPTRHELASVGADGSVRLWNVDTGSGAVLGKHDGPSHLVAFSPNGNAIASAGEDGIVRLWRRDRSAPAVELRGHTGWVTALAFSPDGKYLASGGFDRTLRVWHLGNRQARVWRAANAGPIQRLVFSPDSTRIATAGGSKRARIWDVATGEQRALQTHSPVTAVVWQPDSNAVITACRDGSIRVWSDDLPHDPTALRAWLAAKTAR